MCQFSTTGEDSLSSRPRSTTFSRKKRGLPGDDSTFNTGETAHSIWQMWRTNAYTLPPGWAPQHSGFRSSSHRMDEVSATFQKSWSTPSEVRRGAERSDCTSFPISINHTANASTLHRGFPQKYSGPKAAEKAASSTLPISQGFLPHYAVNEDFQGTLS